jgi:hypothetical protein
MTARRAGGGQEGHFPLMGLTGLLFARPHEPLTQSRRCIAMPAQAHRLPATVVSVCGRVKPINKRAASTSPQL